MSVFAEKHNLDSSIKELPEDLRVEFKQFKEGYVRFCQAIHAEANAILFSPVQVAGKLLFATTNPCPECAKMIVQKGVAGVVYVKPYKTDPTGKPLLAEETKRLFDEANIPCINVPVPDWYWGWFSEEIMDSGEGIFDSLTDRKRD
jgi:deoxycytidylate deaminase